MDCPRGGLLTLGTCTVGTVTMDRPRGGLLTLGTCTVGTVTMDHPRGWLHWLGGMPYADCIISATNILIALLWLELQ